MTKDERCTHIVYRGTFGRESSQCYRRKQFDGYCNQHHPDTVEKKKKEQARKDGEMYRIKRMEYQGPSAIKAMLKAHEELVDDKPLKAMATLRIWLRNNHHL